METRIMALDLVYTSLILRLFVGPEMDCQLFRVQKIYFYWRIGSANQISEHHHMKILKAIASYAEKSWEQPFQCKYVFHPSLDGASIGVLYMMVRNYVKHCCTMARNYVER